MDKRFIVILAVIVAAFGGLLWFTNKGKNNTGDGSGQVSNHVQGAGTKGVTLVEYGDFECGGCYQYFPVVKQVKAKYGDDITFQFRHFPLTQAHPNAMAAHRAAEAAGLQGKFFEMHDQLYQNQPNWSAANGTSSTAAIKTFEAYAVSLGLDITKFQQDFAAVSVNGTINADYEAGSKAGVSGTPTFFINGKKYETENLRSLDDFAAAIDEAIAAKQPSQ